MGLSVALDVGGKKEALIDIRYSSSTSAPHGEGHCFVLFPRRRKAVQATPTHIQWVGSFPRGHSRPMLLFFRLLLFCGDSISIIVECKGVFAATVTVSISIIVQCKGVFEAQQIFSDSRGKPFPIFFPICPFFRSSKDIDPTVNPF